MGKLKKVQQKVLQGVEGSDRKSFLQIFHHVTQDHGPELYEAVQSMHVTEISRLCKGLKGHLQAALDDIDQETHVEGTMWDPIAVQCLEGIASIVLGMLERSPSAQVCELLLPITEVMHDCVLLAAASHPQLQDCVSKCCELWWQREIEGKEALVAQTIPFLLVRALTSGRHMDVKRCYAIRSALQLLDYEDSSILDLKRLLLRAAFAPAFLRNLQGRRYLSYLFTVHPGLVQELAAIIRNQVPSGRQSVLQAYSDVLFRAWRDAVGPCLIQVEEVVQGLMQASILAAEPSLASSLRSVLDGFHAQKHVKGVDALLLRLYEPILFRAVAAPNAAVRCNALHVLEAAFPLQDAELEPAEVDELLTKQFRLLGDALDDPVPAVRRAAASVTCQVLNVWWELIPGSVTTQLLKRLCGLAYDATSAPVRVAAVQGLAGLVDNALAQPMLKVVLPTLAALIGDPSVKVRCALIKLLTVVRTVRHIKFCEIVSVEQLLDMMAVGPREISGHVQKLLLPTFLPNPAEGALHVSALLKSSPAAGKAFCSALSHSLDIPLEQIVDLAAALRDHLISAATVLGVDLLEKDRGTKRREGPAGRRAKGAAEEKSSILNDDEARLSADAWEALAEGLSELCLGLLGSKKVGAEEAATAVGDLFENGGLAELLKACPSARARVAVLSIATAFPELPASAEVRGRCLVALAGPAGRGSALEGHEAAALIAIVSSSGYCLERLLSMLSESLEAGRTWSHETGEDVATVAPSVASMSVIRCRTCGSGRREEDILLCDGCNAAYHTDCLVEPLKQVPEHDWFCPECETLLGTGLSIAPAVRYLGELVRSEGARSVAVTSEELPTILFSLRQWVVSQVAVAVVQLKDEEAITSDGLSPSLLLLPEALQVLCRLSIHLAHAPNEQGKTTKPNKDGHDEAANAAWDGLDAAVHAARDLLGGVIAATASDGTAGSLHSSPVTKKAKMDSCTAKTSSSSKDPLAAVAAEALVAILSLLSDVPALQLVAPPGKPRKPSMVAAKAEKLVCDSLSAARMLSSSPWTASSPLSATLELIVCHSAKFARHSLAASSSVIDHAEAGSARLFDEGHGDAPDDSSHLPGKAALEALLATAVGTKALDLACSAALRPFLSGLVGAATTAFDSKAHPKPCAVSWLGPLLDAIGEVFASIQPETLVSSQLDYGELAQEVAILQPILKSAKFLGHATELSVEATAAAVAYLQKGNPKAALGGCQFAALLQGAGRSKPTDRHLKARCPALERHLETLRQILNGEKYGAPSLMRGGDLDSVAAIGALKVIPFLWGNHEGKEDAVKGTALTEASGPVVSISVEA